jgi:hypothetical protein
MTKNNATNLQMINFGSSLEYLDEVTETEGNQVNGGLFGCGGTFPYVRKLVNYPSPPSRPAEGVCDVNMSCLPEPDSGGGICGVNMSCVGEGYGSN